ncbi:MAG: hypothetical protein LEGION0398_MBIBDBAK_00946 [Legionellaceae bacterium]
MIRKILKLFIYLFTFVFLFLYLFLYTESGSRYLLKHLSFLGLSIQQVSGKIAGPLVLENICYQEPNKKIMIDKISLDWSPLTLFLGKIEFNTLIANTITVTLLQQSNKNKDKVTETLLPKNIFLKKGQINYLRLNFPNNKHSLIAQTILINSYLQSNNFYLNTEWKNLNWLNSNLMNSTFLHHGIDGKITLLLSEKTSLIKKLSLMSKNTEINITGNLADYMNVNWFIHLKNIEELIPESKGEFLFTGSMNGLKELPQINAKLYLNNVILQDYKFKKIIANIDSSDKHLFTLTMKGKDFLIKNYSIPQFLLNAKGTKEQHVINATLITKEGQIKTKIEGQLNFPQKKWQSQIIEFNLISQALGNWLLLKPALISISPFKKSVENFILNNKKQFISMTGFTEKNAHSEANIQVNSLLLRELSSIFSKKIQLDTILNANLHFEKDYAKKLMVQGEVNFSKGKLGIMENKKMHFLNFHSASLKTLLNNLGLKCDFHLLGIQQQKIQANIQLPHFPQPFNKQNIIAKTNIAISDFKMLSLLIPTLKKPQGKLIADLDINGLLNHPTIKGKIDLINGETFIPDLGINLHHINITAHGNLNDYFFLRGKIFSKNEPLFLKGKIRFLNKALTGNLSFIGKHFLISDRPEYQIYISPQLGLKFDTKKILLNGSLTIPKATIRLHSDTEESTDVSNDIQYLDPNGNPIDNTPFNLYTHVNLMLGDDIKFNYSGLSGKLNGHLLIEDTPNTTTTGLGHLYLMGHYKAYGQALTIQQGNLIFTGGDITNPSLNIKAIKKIALMSSAQEYNHTLTNAAALVTQGNKIITGIQVLGTLQKRQITLFSEPPILNQTDILSYLIIGRPAAEASKADIQLIYNAASTLDFSLSEQIKNTLGLDEINIGSLSSLNPQQNNTTTQNTSLILGKALTPKLYLNYSIGLLKPINTLRLRYFFTPNWILQSETNSVANAIDLFYTFDK